MGLTGAPRVRKGWGIGRDATKATRRVKAVAAVQAVVATVVLAAVAAVVGSLAGGLVVM